jgi:hypothetical protein
MLRPRRLRRIGSNVVPGVRVEVAVAVELERVPSHEIRPGLDHVADDGAGDVPGVGGVVVGLDADLGERVRAGLIGHEVVDRFVHVDAVDDVVVRLLAIAVHVRPPAPEIANRGERSRVDGDDARQQQRQLPGVAAVQRQADDGRARDHLADRRRFGLQQRRHPHDLHRFLDRAELQLEVHPQDLFRLDADRPRRRGFEARQLRLEHVSPDRHRRDCVVARLVRHGRVIDVCRLVGRRHRGPRHGRAALIGDDAGERPGAGLSRGVRGQQKTTSKEQERDRREKPRGSHSSSYVKLA